MSKLSAAVAALKPLGEKLGRMLGMESLVASKRVLAGAEGAFPGIFTMTKDEFVTALKSGQFATKFADDMAGAEATREFKNMTKMLRKAGKLQHGMQEAHLPATGLSYETKVFGYVSGEEVIAGGYMYRKSPSSEWIRAGLYSRAPKIPTGDKYSIAKVISAKMAAAGGFKPASLSTPGARSYWDVIHSLRANMEAGIEMVKRTESGFTTPGVAQTVTRGGSRRGPIGGN